MKASSVHAPALGVDGCRAGWLAASIDVEGNAQTAIYSSLTALLEDDAGAHLILIDIPIGLKTAGSDGRRCDRLARRLLGRKRSSSVFSPPCRAAARAEDYDAACAINFIATGKKLSKQAWGIVPKIAEADRLLEKSSELRTRLVEVHPEILFWALRACDKTTD